MSEANLRLQGGERQIARRDILIGSALLGAAGLGLAGTLLNQPRKLPALGLQRLIPEQAGRWRSVGTGGVIVPERGDLSRETYDQVLTRIYVAEALPPVMMLIAYGGSQSGNMQLHRPEACYPAAGFTLGSAEDVVLDGLSARPIDAQLIEARSRSRIEQILYWTRIGARFPRTAWAQRLAVVEDNLKGEVPDGVLVRVSTLDQPLRAALPLLTEFMRELVVHASAPARELLVGKA